MLAVIGCLPGFDPCKWVAIPLERRMHIYGCRYSWATMRRFSALPSVVTWAPNLQSVRQGRPAFPEEVLEGSGEARDDGNVEMSGAGVQAVNADALALLWLGD